ncbi:glycoside hydrolase family 97 protein [Paraglaciecola sp. L3A3]|uniref:glycoside hydrolase family 97 protein n=1 Tax=Paraglaciecola sp. L3A3 TaxID=2686358 RepID=UPI001E3743C8|nr:glycoside hydrolase family 97 protein [Paraglaciecola sp. L3A3]
MNIIKKCISVSVFTCFIAQVAYSQVNVVHAISADDSGFSKQSRSSTQSREESYFATSPDKRINLVVSWDTGASPQYTVSFYGQAILLPSNVNMLPQKIQQGEQQAEHDLVLISEQKIDETWSLPWGQFKESRNQYNAASFKLINKETQEVISTLEFRIFNDAVALRHVFDSPKKSTNRVLLEDTQFKLAEDASSWSYNGMKPTKKIKSILKSNTEILAIPTTLTSGNLPALAIQEASRFETAMMQLETVAGSAQLAVVSEPIVMSNPPSSTAWRVIQIADTAGELITSQVLLNLSPESQIKDTSWINTGKSFWDWRVRGEQYGEHTYGLDNESLSRMINFAAEHNMQYVMIDANWYGPEHDVESDPFTEIDGLNIKALIKQANEKGIGFILYLNDKASKNNDLDKLFETWASWGAAGVKYGFMKLNGKEKVLKTLNIVELAAKHQLLINFHDKPIVPSGMRRTWPNWVTREAVHAQADGKETYTPSGFVEMAHVNALAGPLDMSNGFFKLNGLKQSRNYVRADVNSTVASEVARSLIIFSGLIIFPDAPEEYLRKKDLFEFLNKMPATWDESKVISSDISQHIITARRSGEDWFIGAAINEAGGTLPLELDFLTPDKTYQAKIYADATDSHYITNREAYDVATIQVKKGDSLKMKLAPGGGQAIWLTPIM